MNKYKKNIGTFVFCVIVFIAIIIVYFFYDRTTINYNSLKIDQSKDLVYTASKEQYDFYFQYKPFFNLKGELGKVLNKDIEDFVNTFKEDNIGITYESDLNGKVLSLVIIVEDHGYLESANIIYFRSYNVDLDEEEIIDDDTLFSYYGMERSEVESKLDNGILNFYNELVDAGTYNSKECDYKCFLETREFNKEHNDVYYFVRDGKLIAFKPYIAISQKEEEVHDFVIE